MGRIAVVLVAALAFTANAQVADGDRSWNNRAGGQEAGRARTEPIDAAIRAYQLTVSRTPDDLEARWKLLRAYRFKGAYVARSNEEKKRVYGEAKLAGLDALNVVNRRLRENGVADPVKASERDIATAAQKVAGAAEVFLWDAINWGEWALAYGKLAAVREGAAERIRRGATIAHLTRPSLEGGTPARVLGRLHDQTPRVPFITGWASGREAVRFLRESLRLDPTSKITKVFLAEALIASDASGKPEAMRLLRDVASAPSNPDFLVEEDAATADAKALLRKLGS